MQLTPPKGPEAGSLHCKVDLVRHFTDSFFHAKNWIYYFHLFLRSFTICFISSCCLQAIDVNPREWLTDVLTRIPEYNNDYTKDLAELLPYNWKNFRENLKTTTKLEALDGWLRNRLCGCIWFQVLGRRNQRGKGKTLSDLVSILIWDMRGRTER